jgi:hypothetical protein
VAAWLYRRDRVEWGVAFTEDGITGAQLTSWPGVHSGTSVVLVACIVIALVLLQLS